MPAYCKRIVKQAVDSASFSRGQYDAKIGKAPQEAFSAYLRGWESFFCELIPPAPIDGRHNWFGTAE